MGWFDWLTGVRADALEIQRGVAASNSTASVANLISGAGTTRDPLTYQRPNLGRRYLLPEETFVLMRGGLYRRLCAIKPAWATRAGWSTGNESVDVAFRRLGVSHHFQFADTWGRGTGEFRLWLVTGGDDEKPLAPDEKIKSIQRLDRREFWPIEWLNDMSEGQVGSPTLYEVQPTRAGLGFARRRVHASRMLDFYGDSLPPSERGVEGWGDRDALAQVVWAALCGLDTTTHAGARIASELLVNVFQIAGLTGASTGDDAETLMARMQGVNLMKSISNAIWMGQDEQFVRSPANVSGYRDLSDQARLMLSAVDGTPQTLLFGMPPAGLNTDGASWQQMWHADVAQHQEARYRQHLEYIARHIGTDDVEITFRPLGETSALERAQLRLAVTQADALALQEGILTVEDVRQRYSKPGRFSEEIEQPIGEVDDFASSVSPDEESVALQLVREQLARADGAGEPVWIGLDVDPSALPDLPADAHVTLLYMGEVQAEDMPEVLTAVREVAAAVGAPEVWNARRRLFPVGRHGAPDVYELEAGGFAPLNTALLCRLAHLVSRRQCSVFRPHITVGYVPSDQVDAHQLGPDVECDRLVLSRLLVRQGVQTVLELELER